MLPGESFVEFRAPDALTFERRFELVEHCAHRASGFVGGAAESDFAFHCGVPCDAGRFEQLHEFEVLHHVAVPAAGVVADYDIELV